MTSGVPQGSDLGPLLFPIVITDTPDCVSSSTSQLYADDSIIYKFISTSDTINLKQRYGCLAGLGAKWLKRFNAKTYQVLQITNNLLPHPIPSMDQGLRASSLQFTSPLEFNAIFRDGFTPRLDLTAGSKIRDPVTAKFKHGRLL